MSSSEYSSSDDDDEEIIDITDHLLVGYTKFILTLLKYNKIYDLAVVGDTIYSDLASYILTENNRDHLRLGENTSTELFQHKYNVYGDKSGKYHELNEIKLDINNVNFEELESHANCRNLRKSAQLLLKNSNTISLKKSLKRETIKIIYKLCDSMNLIVTTEYKAYFVRKIIIDFTNHEILGDINVLCYKNNQIFITELGAVRNKLMSDLFSLIEPRKFQYFNNIYNVNTLHLPSSKDPFLAILSVIYCKFILER